MKINELVKEGFWSGLGNLAHGAVKGATSAMKNAPDSLSASTRLAADPNKIKALPNTFKSVKKSDGTDELTSPDGKETVVWDSKKRTLTVSGDGTEVVYQKLKSGWKDMQTDENIPPSAAKELDDMFDIASGKVAPPKPKQPKAKTVKPIQVKLPTSGIVVTKSPEDGIWRLPDGEEVTTPEYVAKLEARAKAMGQYYK